MGLERRRRKTARFGLAPGGLALAIALTGCGRDRFPQLVEDCTTKAGAWRFGTGQSDVILLSIDQDPLARPDSVKSERRVDAPLSGSWLLEHRFAAVEFPLRSEQGYDLVGRVMLLADEDPRCQTFRRDPETVAAGDRLSLKTPAGYCIGLERGVSRTARYALVTTERVSDGGIVDELIDLEGKRVLARVVDFLEEGSDNPRSCAQTPRGDPAPNAMDFVLASLTPEAPTDRSD